MPVKIKIKFFPLFLALFAVGCGKHNDSKSGGSVSPSALPAAWVKLPENGEVAASKEEPSLEANEAVRAAFKAHTDALSSLVPTDLFAPAMSVAPAGHPSDWTPWHLDGMIADFGLTIDGLFGAILGEGQTTLRVTWQKVAAQGQTNAVKAAKKATVQVRSNMTADELNRQIEPTIHTALATGSIKNESALRRNLADRSRDFLALTRVLGKLKPMPHWALESFQLELPFNADGKVTPVIGAGGGMMIVLLWSFSHDEGNPASGLSPQDTRLLEGVTNLARIVGPTLTELSGETGNLKRKGLVLDEFHLGIGMIAGKDIGIVQAGAQPIGILKFEKSSTDGLMNDAQFSGFENGFVNLVSDQVSPEHLEFAARNGVAVERQHDGQGAIYKISQKKFKTGLAHALKMAGYFIDRAHEVRSSTWKLAELEAVFATSIGGDFKMVAVQGTGQIEFTFHPPHP